MHHPGLNTKLKDLMAFHPEEGDFGVELEIEGIKLPNDISGWKVKSENSLRNLSQGGPGEAIEYATAGAFPCSLLETKLKQLYKLFTREGTKVVLTPRASTHIHINMQQQTLKTYFGYLMLFTTVEPLLMRLCGPERNGNLFCLPSYETGDIAMVAAHQTQQLIDGVSLQNWRNRGKYACLNTDPIKTFGSLEVRCFPNCILPETILQWAQWLMNIRNLAASWHEDTYSGLFTLATDNPDALINKIFTGDVNFFRAVYPHNIADVIGIGAEVGYEVYRATKPVFDYRPEAHQKKKRQHTLDPNELTTAEAVVMFDDPSIEGM